MTENTVQLVSLERLQLQQMIMGFRTTQLLHVAATLGIADQLEAGPRPVAALAASCGCRAEELYRILRALSNFGIVRELADGCFELASLGEHLRTHAQGSLRAIAALYGERWIWNAYGELLHSVRTGEPAFDAVHGRSFFDYLQQDEIAARSFNAAMTSYSAQEVSAVTPPTISRGSVRSRTLAAGMAGFSARCSAPTAMRAASCSICQRSAPVRSRPCRTTESLIA